MSEMTKDQALTLFDSKWWEDKTAHEIVAVQLYEDRLIMPFGDFQGAVEKALGRPVWTHEFARPESLRAEFEGREDSPADPQQHAMDSLAAMLLAIGKDPDESMIVIGGGDDD